MKYLALVPVLALMGCVSYDLPKGMLITETLYESAQALQEVCGAGTEACVFTDYSTFCDMHLPVAANGQPLHREHELRHCAGGEDAPVGQGVRL